MQFDNIIFALEEEIGNTDLFIGRESELEYFLKWIDMSKNKISQSTAILARRRVGKTALVQRLYNIVYTKNDPQIIPFYFRMPEGKMTQLDFSLTFYCALLTQYFGYKLRDIKLIRRIANLSELKKLAKKDKIILKDIENMEEAYSAKSSLIVWDYAREAGHRISSLKDERIIQILDEFQYLDEFMYTDETYTNRIDLARFYQKTGSSKISPQLITGSQVGWLTAIIRRMVARYKEYYLGSFTDEEALAAVYNYSNIFKQPVTSENAVFMTSACVNDAFYIASMFTSDCPNKDLTSKESIVETLMYETDPFRGNIARIWLEYIWYAFDRINDRNAKKVTLYLAKYGYEEKSREQILKDLQLDMTDGELEEKLHKIAKVDIISYGRDAFYFKGLGDKIFEIVFRRMYESDIERVDKRVEPEIRVQLMSMQKSVAYF